VRCFYKDWQDKKFGGGHRLFILDGASRSRELGYREELERIAAEVPWLKYVPTVSRPWEDPSWKGETGRVDDLIRKYADQWNLTPESATAYLCGHPGMIENVNGILQRRGWDEKAIKREAFFVDASAHQI
jgi:ferredoxin--NADP+ reductase